MITRINVLIIFAWNTINILYLEGSETISREIWLKEISIFQRILLL